MSTLDQLVQRMDAEFSAVDEQLKRRQESRVREYASRKERLGQLDELFEKLSGIWRPRLEALAAKFGEKVKVTPRITPSAREATFAFQSNLARIELRFLATTDHDVRKLILVNDLEIIPVLMQYDTHAEISFPLEQVDVNAVTEWIDDRLVGFVKTYLSLHENDLYLKEEMVEDPVANVRFPKFAAGAKLENQGRTFYFISEETRKDYAKANGISLA